MNTVLARIIPNLTQRSLQIDGGTNLMNYSVRGYSDNPPPLCNKKDNSNKKEAKQVCGKEGGKKPAKDQGFQFHHLIAYPKFCCEDPCGEEFPRFDECLYKPSDKNRPYQQTWVECPKLQIKPKKICCFDKGIPPQIPRRKPKKIEPKCAEECPDEGKCPKIKMPGCRPVALVTSCKLVRPPLKCKKVKAPYPAYSECKRPKTKCRRMRECECLERPMMCIVYKIQEEYKRTGRNVLKCP